MKTLIIQYVGEDGWGRPVYRSQEGKLLKDVNLGMGELMLCTVNKFDGEPDTPISELEQYKNLIIRRK